MIRDCVNLFAGAKVFGTRSLVEVQVIVLDCVTFIFLEALRQDLQSHIELIAVHFVLPNESHISPTTSLLLITIPTNLFRLGKIEIPRSI